jgi:hypothetical protein
MGVSPGDRVASVAVIDQSKPAPGMSGNGAGANGSNGHMPRSNARRPNGRRPGR